MFDLSNSNTEVKRLGNAKKERKHLASSELINYLAKNIKVLFLIVDKN